MKQLLNVASVSKQFVMGGLFSRDVINAVSDVSFALSAETAEIFTIIGESGSGKTTLARMILGLEKPSSGAISFDGLPVSDSLSRRERLSFMRRLQPVFQNPFEAFNPLKQVDRYLLSTAKTLLGVTEPEQIEAAMDAALRKVGLSLKEIAGRYAHELSGGQLQRVAIARALIPEPELVSMVDASLRMSIVNLLRDLRDKFGVSVIYITHDLATAYYISDRIMIMQKGHVVEMGPAKPILEQPEHPYSKLLKASVLSTEDAGQGTLQPADRTIVQAAWERPEGGKLVERAGGRLGRIY